MRQLTQEERTIWSGAVIKAVSCLPALREALALCKPYYDETCQTAYIDPYYRVGLSPMFFTDEIPIPKKAATVLHETMHMLNNHYERCQKINMQHEHELSNIAADFEINSVLNKVPNIDISDFIYPTQPNFNFEEHLTYEQYVKLLQKQEKYNNKNNKDSQSFQDKTGDKKETNGQYCDTATEERQSRADKIGVQRTSESEKIVISARVQAQLEEELKKAKACGQGTRGNYLEYILKGMVPPKIDWQKVFRSVISHQCTIIMRGSKEYTYKRPHRRKGAIDYYNQTGTECIGHDEFIFPIAHTYAPSILVGVDTSGSMGSDDFKKAIYEVNGILQETGKKKVSFVTIDTEIKSVQSIKDIKQIKLTGGGGTNMAPLYDFVNKDTKANKYDIMVIITDGHFNWDELFAAAKKTATLKNKIKTIVCVTSKTINQQNPIPSLMKIINISSDEK